MHQAIFVSGSQAPYPLRRDNQTTGADPRPLHTRGQRRRQERRGLYIQDSPGDRRLQQRLLEGESPPSDSRARSDSEADRWRLPSWISSSVVFLLSSRELNCRWHGPRCAAIRYPLSRDLDVARGRAPKLNLSPCTLTFRGSDIDRCRHSSSLLWPLGWSPKPRPRLARPVSHPHEQSCIRTCR